MREGDERIRAVLAFQHRPRFALAAQFSRVISDLGHKSLSSVIRPRRWLQQEKQKQKQELLHPLSLLRSTARHRKFFNTITHMMHRRKRELSVYNDHTSMCIRPGAKRCITGNCNNNNNNSKSNNKQQKQSSHSTRATNKKVAN